MRRRSAIARVLLCLAAMFLLASTDARAQVIIRPRPGQPGVTIVRPTFEPPYRLTIRVFVTPYDEKRVLAPGQGIALRLTDAAGRHLGVDPDTGAMTREMPNGTYEPVVNLALTAPIGPRGRAGVGIALDDPADGEYLLEVIGEEPARYEIAAEVWDRLGRRRWTHLLSGMTERGAVDRYDVRYTAAAEGPIDVHERRDDSYLDVRLYPSPLSDEPVGALLLTDPHGRRLGDDPATRAQLREIPRAVYGDVGGDDPGLEIEMGQLREGAYTLEVVGTRAGRYLLSVRATQNATDQHLDFDAQDVPITRGARHRYRFDYVTDPQRPLRLAGGYGAPPRLVTFAQPVDAPIRLRPGATTYPLLVFYAAELAAGGLQATLNGADVTRSFAPTPGGSRLVALRLGRGTSTLVVTARGTATGVTQTQRIVLVVP